MILHDNRKVVYNLFVGYFCRVTVDLYCPGARCDNSGSVLGGVWWCDVTGVVDTHRVSLLKWWQLVWRSAVVFTPAPCLWPVELETKLCKVWSFTITKKVSTRALSWMKVATTAFTFKKLSRHYAKRALTPQSLNVKLGLQRNYHKGRAV